MEDPLEGRSLADLEHDAFGECEWHPDDCKCKIKYPTMADVESMVRRKKVNQR